MEKEGAEETERHLPSPPSVIPTNVNPQQFVEPLKPIRRTGFGKDGRHINLIANYFRVSVNVPDLVFFQYNVSIKSEDNQAIERKGMGRKIMDKLYQTYSSEMAGKPFAYDGEKTLFTVGMLPFKKSEFTVVLEDTAAKRSTPGLTESSREADRKRSKQSFRSKTFNVEISFSRTVPMNPIPLALEGLEAKHSEDAIRVLDIVLRQQAAKRGCLLVRQSFFYDDVRNFVSIGGGVSACRGFHSSFRATQGGLSLNTDVSSTMILTPSPVLDFILTNQNIKDPRHIDWGRAKKMLKNLKIKTTHTKMEFRIRGFIEKACNQQYFPRAVRNEDGSEGSVNITVADYFNNDSNIRLSYSACMPCLDAGKPGRPNYLPLELCSLVSLQRYTKTLSSVQRASLVEKSSQKPLKRIQKAVQKYRYEDDPMLKACGISIEKQLIAVEGRVLNAPKLKVGHGEDCFPRNGRWNFNQKRLYTAIKIENWVIVNFSARCNTSHLSRELISCGKSKGMNIERPYSLIDEDPRWIRSGPVVRVEKMFQKIYEKLGLSPFSKRPMFLLCVLPERKTCDLYGPWKKENLHEEGIVTQCISPGRISDQYITNVLLKINSKLGGINSVLEVEDMRSLPFLKNTPTMILGMDVSHGSPGQADIPSIAAVVGSRCWPLISRYCASVRTQSARMEMIDSLFKPLPNGEDIGIIGELLNDFCESSRGQKPEQVIIFRDGVSESQFNQVLNIELEQIIKAFEHFDPTPTMFLLVRLFVYTFLLSAGTVVDTGIVHPRNYDFYMCAQNGSIGTSRPAHYHVLLDEIGFSADELQNLVHSLSYVYQRSTSAISVVAPVRYAHLAAAQMGQFMKFEESSCSDSLSSAGTLPIPEPPRLHKDVRTSMFFC